MLKPRWMDLGSFRRRVGVATPGPEDEARFHSNLANLSRLREGHLRHSAALLEPQGRGPADALRPTAMMAVSAIFDEDPAVMWNRVALLIGIVAPLCGCQPLSLGSNKEIAAKHTAEQSQVAQRDDDTVTGRLKTSSKQVSQTVSKPFDRDYRRAQNKAAAVRKKALAKQRKKDEPSPLVAWLFPEPKVPQTLPEWLAQDRLDP